MTEPMISSPVSSPILSPSETDLILGLKPLTFGAIVIGILAVIGILVYLFIYKSGTTDLKSTNKDETPSGTLTSPTTTSTTPTPSGTPPTPPGTPPTPPGTSPTPSGTPPTPPGTRTIPNPSPTPVPAPSPEPSSPGEGFFNIYTISAIAGGGLLLFLIFGVFFKRRQTIQTRKQLSEELKEKGLSISNFTQEQKSAFEFYRKKNNLKPDEVYDTILTKVGNTMYKKSANGQITNEINQNSPFRNFFNANNTAKVLAYINFVVIPMMKNKFTEQKQLDTLFLNKTVIPYNISFKQDEYKEKGEVESPTTTVVKINPITGRPIGKLDAERLNLGLGKALTSEQLKEQAEKFKLSKETKVKASSADKVLINRANRITNYSLWYLQNLKQGTVEHELAHKFRDCIAGLNIDPTIYNFPVIRNPTNVNDKLLYVPKRKYIPSKDFNDTCKGFYSEELSKRDISPKSKELYKHLTKVLKVNLSPKSKVQAPMVGAQIPKKS